MNKLATSHWVLALKSPVIAGSSGLTASINKIDKIVEAGVGTIVLKSYLKNK